MPPKPISVHALAQALADIRPPTDTEGVYSMWLAACRAIAGAMPEDFAHNFTLLCKTLTPTEPK